MRLRKVLFRIGPCLPLIALAGCRDVIAIIGQSFF